MAFYNGNAYHFGNIAASKFSCNAACCHYREEDKMNPAMKKRTTAGGFLDEEMSIRVTKIVIALMIAASIALLVFGPKVTKYCMARQSPLFEGTIRYIVSLCCGYVLGLLLLTCLYALWKLIGRIGEDTVFVEENVKALVVIERVVGIAAVICIFTGLTCIFSALFVGLMAVFMALIVRVIRGAFAKAVLMREELDLTI